MNNEPKKIYDIVSLTNDIREREDIVNRYMQMGFLDRNDAIKKIVELRDKDEKVNVAANIEIAASQQKVPLEYVNNDILIAELKKQIAILSVELYEETHNK